MSKIITTIVVLHCSICVVLKSQEHVPVAPKTKAKVGIFLNGGLNSTTGKEISQIYDLGYSLELGVVIKLASNHLWIMPSLGGTYFGNQPNNALRDDLFLRNAGSSAAWLFPLGKNATLKLAPEFGFYFVSGNNKFKPRKGYTGRTIEVYSFKDISINPGLSLMSDQWKLTAAYKILHVKGKLNETLKDEIATSAWGEFNPPIYEMYKFSDPEFKMSHLQLSITFIF